MTLLQIGSIADIAANSVTFLAAGAAAYWFIFTRSFRQRAEFDCELRIFDVGPDEDYLAELVLIVENKGQREHRIHNLWCEVRQPGSLAGSGEPTSYLPQRNLVTTDLGYFFVPPGVRQTFPVSFRLPRDAKLVRAIAIFVYQQKRLPNDKHFTLQGLSDAGFSPHQIAKLFVVAPTEAATAAGNA
jgi:hypothetical protein